MDRLTIEEVENCIIAGESGNFSQECQIAVAKQLADTMRENERLKAKIEGMEGAIAIERMYAEDKRNKEAEMDKKLIEHVALAVESELPGAYFSTCEKVAKAAIEAVNSYKESEHDK